MIARRSEVVSKSYLSWLCAPHTVDGRQNRKSERAAHEHKDLRDGAHFGYQGIASERMIRDS